MKSILFYLIFLMPFLSLGQQESQPNPIVEDKIPESILCSSVLIETEAGAGSGFFLQDSAYIYFVTARHILFALDDTIFKHIHQRGRLTFYPHNIVVDAPATIDIDLKKAFDFKMIKFDPINDIAVIAIGSVANNLKGGHPSKWITYFQFVKKNKSTFISSAMIGSNTRKYLESNVGAEIYLFGYPNSIGLKLMFQFDSKRPLLRKGIVAGKYENNKTIIIDCPVYFGNSGGPVFEIIKSGIDIDMKIIGVVSQYIPYVVQAKDKYNTVEYTQAMNSGYGIVTPIDYAIELINQFK